MWILGGNRQRHPTTTSTLWWHCRCRSATAYSSDNKCPLSSQLTPISEGRSPIRHLGRRLVAGSSALGCKKTTSVDHSLRCRLKPTRRNMFIRNQWGCQWAEVTSDHGQQPAELHWSSDWLMARLFKCVSQSQNQTLWTFAMMFLRSSAPLSKRSSTTVSVPVDPAAVGRTHVVDYVRHPRLKFWCWLYGAQPLATVLLPSLVHVLGTIFQ